MICCSWYLHISLKNKNIISFLIFTIFQNCDYLIKLNRLVSLSCNLLTRFNTDWTAKLKFSTIRSTTQNQHIVPCLPTSHITIQGVQGLITSSLVYILICNGIVSHGSQTYKSIKSVCFMGFIEPLRSTFLCRLHNIFDYFI